MDIPSLIRSARTSKGLSQSALARKAGVSVHAIWEIEANGNGSVALLSTVTAALDLRFTGLPPGTTIGGQVRILRQKRGWSQERLAEKAGVSAPVIGRLERDHARIASLRAVLAVLAPNARARKPQEAVWAQGNRDVRLTPSSVIQRVQAVLETIDLDPCGTDPLSSFAATTFTVREDGLRRPWFGRVFVNPPYSESSAFIRKASLSMAALESTAILILLPMQSLHTVTFHKHVVGHADVMLLRGRISFGFTDGRSGPAPFGNLLALYGDNEGMRIRLLQQFPGVMLSRSSLVGEGIKF